MIVHRYIGSHLKDSLQNSELKVAKVSEFNDPFEFRYRYVGEFGFAQAAIKLQNHLKDDWFLRRLRMIPRFKLLSTDKILEVFENEKESILSAMVSNIPRAFDALPAENQDLANELVRILCFSLPSENRNEEILRWSHYTNCHNGARISIELSKQQPPLSIVYPVRYNNTLVSVEFGRTTEAQYIRDKIRDSMTTKSECWSYEGEVRSFIPKPHFHTRTQNGRDYDFVKINLDGIERIDFGIRFPESDIGAIIELFNKGNYTKVKFYRAFCSSSDYSIKYTEIC